MLSVVKNLSDGWWLYNARLNVKTDAEDISDVTKFNKRQALNPSYAQGAVFYAVILRKRWNVPETAAIQLIAGQVTIARAANLKERIWRSLPGSHRSLTPTSLGRSRRWADCRMTVKPFTRLEHVEGQPPDGPTRFHVRRKYDKSNISGAHYDLDWWPLPPKIGGHSKVGASPGD